MSIFKPGTLEPVVPVQPTGGPIKGFDIYHGDEMKSFTKAKAAGYEFVFIKSSQGLNGDSKFVQYYKSAKAAGLIAGAYHFMSYNVSGEAQAKKVVSMLEEAGGLEKTDFPITCDWEYSDGHDPRPNEIAVVRAFLGAAKSLTNRTPIIYCSNYLPSAIGNPAWLSEHPLWIARYGGKKPTVPNWAFWQYSESAQIPGLANPGDANLYQGSVEDLKKFVASL